MQSSIFLPLWTDQVKKMFELIVESFRQNYDAKISDSKHNRTGVPANAVVRKYVAPEYITTGTMYATFES